MTYKDQTQSYRTINGVKFTNYADLYYSDEKCAEVIAEARNLYNRVRIMSRGDCKAVFVAQPK